MPSIASLNCHITSGFSGLPKFKQFVAAIGRAPLHATFRAASATACIAPNRGAKNPQRPFPSVASAKARFDSFNRSTAASPAPGPNVVFVCTIESYCSVIQCFEATVGDASKRRKFAVKSAPAAATGKPAAAKATASAPAPLLPALGAAIGLSYRGPSSAIACAGIAAATSP